MTEYTHSTDSPEYSKQNYSQELRDNINLIYKFGDFNQGDLNILREYTNPEKRDLYSIASLFRSDILDLEFCSSPERMAEACSIKVVNQMHEFDFRKAFINYTKQRRSFHLRFIESTLSRQALPDSPQALGIHPLLLPSPRGLEHAPDYMYNITSWAAASMLSTLLRPPEVFSAQDKQHAVEIFAKIMDVEGLNFQSEDYGAVFTIKTPSTQKEKILTLPESFLTQGDNPLGYWRNNRTYRGYFPKGDVDEAGINSLLQNRPEDLLRILLMQTLDTKDPRQKLYEFTQVAGLDDPIKQMIFSENASHNKIFNQQPDSFFDPYAHLADGGDYTGHKQSFDEYTRNQNLQRELAELKAKNEALEQDNESLQQQLEQRENDTVDPTLKHLIETYRLNPRDMRIIEETDDPNIFLLFRSLGKSTNIF